MDKLVVIENKDVLTVEKPVEVLVYSDSQSMVVVSHGPSIGGAPPEGVTYVRDTEPQPQPAKATWWNPLTKQLKVAHNGQWESVAPDGGHF